MKKHILLLCLALGAFQSWSQDTLAAWTLEGETGDQVSNIATVTGNRIQAGSLLSRGSGITAVPTVNTMIARGWTTNTVAAPDDYYEFSITINANASANISSIQVVLDRNSNGPTAAILRSSLDGFTANLGSRNVPLSPILRTYNLSLSNLTGTVTFRLYGHSASNNTGRMSIGPLDGPDLIILGSTTLPLRWTGFQARQSEGKVALEWSTALEQGVSHFEIQRSTDGKEFRSIGTEPAKNGVTNTYRFEDISLAGTSAEACFYRLREIDWDQQAYFSNVLRVALKTGPDVSIHPNPATDYIEIANLQQPAAYQVMDVQGKILDAGTLQAERSKAMRLQVSSLPQGIYFLQVEGQKPLRFIKE